MSTFSSQRQNRPTGENPAAPTHAPNRSQPNSQLPECPVLLRLPDVSRASIEKGFRHITPLEMESALERIESVPQVETQVSEPLEQIAPQPAPPKNTNEQTFASLLAASPALHGKVQAAPAASPVNSPVVPVPTQPSLSARPPSLQPTKPLADPEAKQEETALPSEPPSASPKYHRTDKAAVKPVRRSFRVFRPLWMPEVPPTLLLGALICSTALLVGMLWRSDKAEFQEAMIPAAQEKVQPATEDEKAEALSSPRVAEVPSIPEVPAVPAKNSEQPSKTAEQKPKETSPKSDNKIAATPEKPSVDPLSNVSETSKDQPGISALPPVEAAPRNNNFFGQTLGGPPPHIVNNPHVGNPTHVGSASPHQGPIYEARRPAAEFRGIITKPDATGNHERY